MTNHSLRTAPVVDFEAINQAARPYLSAILKRLLPLGRRQGDEWVARNPRRRDRSPGSFKFNLATGRWADFATDDKGGDVISLVAYLAQTNQTRAARLVVRMLPKEAVR